VLCYSVQHMRPTRPGRTRTFSISVDDETRETLKEAARRLYDGNVSALVTALARELKRKQALEWLLAASGVPRMTDAEADALVAEIEGRAPARKRARRAA
jgi:post-segregation antitoxin (ccd killing protein)